MVQILQGQAVALFAFDIGYEVSLERVRELLLSAPVPPLSRKKKTPDYLQYTRPPQLLNLGDAPVLVERPGQIQATVFDFGAVSLAYRWPMNALDLEKLPELSQQLYGLALEAHAREQLERLVQKIAPAVSRPELAELVEDYYLFVIEKLDAPLGSAQLLMEYRPALAQVLRFDTRPLSAEQQQDALEQHISYYESDLVVIDWNAAIIYDQDYWDTLDVLELLNVELLEARYIDAQLDRRIGDYEGLIQKRAEWPIPLRTPHRRAIEDLAELRIESSLLSERVDNALKLIGDLYLARVYSVGTRRFYLQEWESSISRKLDIVANLYQLLTDRVNTAQGQTLELVIIGLILAEIVLALAR